jgi:116 kDa U5 small nuclear ribonucleoprotein component
MASFEDYDEFGNYIGADLDSDDEDAIPRDDFAPQAAATRTLEGFDEEPVEEAGEGALMQIDGKELHR